MDENRQKILQEALAVLNKRHPFKIYQTNPAPPTDGNNMEALLTVEFGLAEYQLAVEIKKRIDNVSAALHLAKAQNKSPLVIVIPHVSPEMAERLKNDNIEYMDTCGNVFINRPPLYLFVKGNKPHRSLKPAPLIRAFKASGLKVIFTLLSVPNAENRTMRELAELSNVSLGTVNWVMKDLITLGYLVDTGRHGRTLMKKNELFERWVTAYPEQLKTKLNPKSFRAQNTQWWKEIIFEQDCAFWSGEVAASLLTDYLVPEKVTLYVKPPYTKLIVANKLRNDDQGNIEIMEAFWNFSPNNPIGATAPPLLIYADLLATGDSRNIETARIIYDDYIAELIG